ncbi:double zinc ribbon domain-containing protein [Deinococcus sp. UYEF24]
MTYRLCPQCGRAVPAREPERYCPNDGALLLVACPACQSPITSPYARYCTRCGVALTHPSTQAREER